MKKISLQTLNGCIFLGITLGFYILDCDLLTYLTALPCILSVYKLIMEKHSKWTYVQSILMLLCWALLAYTTLTSADH